MKTFDETPGYARRAFLASGQPCGLAFCRPQSDEYKGMRPLANATPTPRTAGEVAETRGLGLAVLVAESVEGVYELVGLVSTIREAREISNDDLRWRCAALEAGQEPLCPERYVVWARQREGRYARVHELGAADVSLEGR